MIKQGYKINYITVISNDIKREGRNKYFFCNCKCGNQKWILEETLRTKRIRDCGCGNYMVERHIGEKYGMLTVVECYRKRINGKVNIIAKCKCDCGNYKDFIISEIKKNHKKSCGCNNRFNFERDYKNKIYNDIEILELVNFEKKRVKCKCHCGNIFECKLSKITSPTNPIISCAKCVPNTKKHQCVVTKQKAKINRIHSIYTKMIDRCYNQNAKDYKWYGQKNIKVFKKWRDNYTNFENWAKNNGYQDNLTIDRINYDGDYEPSNCRWVTMKTQQNNRSNNVKYNYKGKVLTISEISREMNISDSTLRSRIRSGLTFEEAISIPIKKRS